MFFFKRPKYPLPKFPSGVISTFKKLKIVLSKEQIVELRGFLEEFITRFRGDTTHRCRARLPVAELLYDRCRLLLDIYEERSADEQLHMGAAIRYVVLADDPFSDDTFLTGLDDDVRVMNHVLERMKLFEDLIEVPV